MKKWTPKQIRELRKSRGFTQTYFGNSLGVTRNYIYYLERGVRKPNKTLKLLLDCMEEKWKKRKEVKR